MNKINYIKVNPEVLVWARENLAINRNQVSEKTGISSARLNQLENGETKPTLEELKIFSKEYKRTIATLLLDQAPNEKPLPADRRTVDSKDLGSFHEKTIMAVRKARALVKSKLELYEEMGVEIPKFKFKASIIESPKFIANRLRKELNLNEIRQISNINEALEAYIEKVESLGISVFQLSLTQDNLRGFSLVDEELPVIVIKRGSEQAHSKIFTLFHELGHLLLNAGGICDLSESTNLEIEKWCNAFSAELLIPENELLQMGIVKEYSDRGDKFWMKKDLIELGKHFHAGPLAILRSLLENGLTTSAYYKEKHEIWNKASFGRSENPEGRNIPKETIKEKGRTYVTLAFKAFDQNRIDIKDLADFLGVKLSKIQKTRQLLNT